MLMMGELTMSFEGSKKITVLVTGADGCVGRALIDELVESGHNPIPVSRTRSANAINLDLSLPVDRRKLPAKVDAVVHLAQSRQFREFPQSAPEVFAVNTSATVDLVRYAVDAGARSFLYASSGSVYRESPSPVSEWSEVGPVNFYAATKLSSENLLAPYAQFLPISIQRLFYVYGPHQTGMLTDSLASRISRGDPVTLQGKNGIRIAPTFSYDVARIMRRACVECWSNTINVGSPHFVSLREYAELIGEAIGSWPHFAILHNETSNSILPNVEALQRMYPDFIFTSPQDGLKKMFEKRGFV